MQVDPSAISRSTTTENFNSGIRHDILTGKMKAIDSSFPIFDQLTQLRPIPKPVSYLFVIIFYAQCMFATLYPQSSIYDNLSEKDAHSLDIISMIFSFFPRRPSESYIKGALYVLSTITFLSSVIFICAIFHFRSTHRFSKVFLYPIRYILELLSLVLLIPSSWLCGNSFYLLFFEHRSVCWASLIVGILFVIIFGVFSLSWIIINGSTAYLNLSPIATHMPFHLLFFSLFSIIAIESEHIFYIFSKWMSVVPMCLHFLFCFYIIWLMMYLPFWSLIANSIFFGTICSQLCGDFNSIIILFAFPKGAPFYVFFSLSLFVFIGSTIAYFFVMKLHIKSIHMKMSAPSSTIIEEEKIILFQKYGLNNSTMKALKYFYIAFSTASDFFLDSSLLHFLVSSFTETNVYMACIQILSFFPGETRHLNALFLSISSHRDLNIKDRFLIYQVYKIKTLRASSASIDSNDRLADLKTRTSNLELDVKSFWKLKKNNMFFLEHLSDEIKKLNGYWIESISDFPSSSKYSEEYCKFLIECSTDFDKALIQKRRAELIDLGANFTTDYAFKFFISSFPFYLLEDKIDIHGNIKIQNKKNSGSSSRSSGNIGNGSDPSSTGNTSSIELDQDAETALSKQLIRYSKMRMALHHAIIGRKTKSLALFPISAIITALTGLLVFVFVLYFIREKFKERSISMQRVAELGNMRFNMGVSIFLTTLTYVYAHGLYSNNVMTMTAIDDQPYNVKSYITIGSDYWRLMLQYSENARNHFSKLLNDMSDLSIDIDVFGIIPQIVTNSLEVTFCHHVSGSIATQNAVFSIMTPYLSNLRDLISLQSYLISSLISQIVGIKSIFELEDYCDLYLNWRTVVNATVLLSESLSKNQVENGNDLSRQCKIWEIIVFIIVTLFTITPISILLFMYNKEIIYYVDALLSFSPQVKQECMAPIRRDMETDDIPDIPEPKDNGRTKLYLWVLSGLIISFLAFFMVYNGDVANKNITLFNRWEYYAVQRLGLTIEMMTNMGVAILLNQSFKETFLNCDALVSELEKQRLQLLDVNEKFLRGTEDMKACYNYDDVLDEYNFADSCEFSEGSDSLHDTYKCASTNSMISIFNNLIIDGSTSPSSFNGTWSDSLIQHAFHLSTTHMWPRLSNCMDRLVELGKIYYNNLIFENIFIMFFGIVATSCYVVFCILQFSKNRRILNTIFIFVKHVPPLQLVNNKRLLNLLLNRKESKLSGMTIEQSVIRNSEDGILFTDLSGTIELCNPANTEILGFTPEQLLGQPVFSFFKEGNQDGSSGAIQKQMDLIASGQSNAFYEGHAECITDRETTVPCHVTILGIQNQRTSALESFVVVLRDESKLLAHQKEAEEAKACSERLLFQILPRDIVVKLNAGEKDITFTVPTATILFIDIVRFSDYASTLTPEQTMGNLSQIFGRYDTLIVKFPLLYKIKLIGDVYMAAGGLFNQDIGPAVHAEQAIRFCLEVIAEIEDINVKLNCNLAVRIGVNTGGPIIAGVLGTDKPVFDIIGDPINVAARLQSTDVPGRIQIPQSTYELVQNLGFEIEQRGDVFLKGKGKTMTYFVRTAPAMLVQISQPDLSALRIPAATSSHDLPAFTEI